MGLSYYKALAVAPKVSGALSIIGSSLIIRDVYNHNWRKKHRHGCNNGNNNNSSQQSLSTTSCVILSMSIADLGSSFWAHFMSTWLVPKDDDVAEYATGNQATCTTQAFLYELFITAGLWSTAVLAITYWLIVCREMSETTLRQWKWQLILLGLPWIFGIANSFPKLILGTASYNGFWWCELADGTMSDNLLDQISCGVAFLLIIFSMGSLVRYVYLREKKMDRFQYPTNNNREHTIQVTCQGLFYIGVWLFIVLPTIAVTVSDDSPTGFMIFWACVFPLQGFGNACIFFRPKYKTIVKREQNNGKRWISASLSATAQVLDIAMNVPAALRKVDDNTGVTVGKDSGANNEEIAENVL